MLESGTFSGTDFCRGHVAQIGDCPRKSGTSGHLTVVPRKDPSEKSTPRRPYVSYESYNSFSCGDDELPYINVSVNGVDVRVLVDTGATVSVIDDNFRRKHPMLKHVPVVPIDMTVYSSTGDNLHVSSFIEMNLSTTSSSYFCRLMEVKGL